MKELIQLSKTTLGILLLLFALASCGLDSDVIDIAEPMDDFPDTTITSVDRGELEIHHPDGSTVMMQGHGSILPRYDSLDVDYIIISSYEHDCYGVVDTLDLNSEAYYFRIIRDPQAGILFDGYFITVDEVGGVTLAITAQDLIYYDAETGEERSLGSTILIEEQNEEFVRGYIHAEFIILTNPNDNQAFSIGEIEFEFGVPFDIEC